MDEEEAATEDMFPPTSGERLKAAREEMGMTMTELAAKSKIPERHLALIDSGDLDDLPARTYAVGFSRTYARLVGLDEREIADQVRAELDAAAEFSDGTGGRGFEPGDPARLPSRKLAWFTALAAILLAIGGFSFFGNIFSPAGSLGSLIEEEEPEEPAAAQLATSDTQDGDAIPAEGTVVFTALEDGVWVKFSDGAGRQLMQKQMSRGERYELPGDAEDPVVSTGRPDAFSITIGGREVAKLDTEPRTITDIPISAEALLARFAPEVIATPSPEAITSTAPQAASQRLPTRQPVTPVIREPTPAARPSEAEPLTPTPTPSASEPTSVPAEPAPAEDDTPSQPAGEASPTA